MFSHERHFTITFFPGNLSNRLEPHFGQIGHARTGSINLQRDMIDLEITRHK
jgi:hypothetical protein